jgi:hypothetical protein
MSLGVLFITKTVIVRHPLNILKKTPAQMNVSELLSLAYNCLSMKGTKVANIAK